MQLHLAHATIYRYDQPASLIIQALRLWPSNADEQKVLDWRVEIDGRQLHPSCSDGFGNRVATHTIDRSVDSVRISVRGRVDTRDTSGIHGDGGGSLPPMFYLNTSALTAVTDEMRAVAAHSVGEGTDLERLHRLSNAVRDRVDYVTSSTHAETTAAEAFNAGAGVCQDHAHVLIGCARSLGFAARYVSGYLCPIEDQAAASHAWAELFVDELGWVGFDAANRQAPDERYVRIACGRDYRDAAPVRGVRIGGVAESLEVQVSIAESPDSAQ
jgi:transglutaminase-like putative cysteine protease